VEIALEHEEEELTSRERGYLQLIRDLQDENCRLKILLVNSDKNETVKCPSTLRKKTPSITMVMGDSIN
jgi:hypothetical protein